MGTFKNIDTNEIVRVMDETENQYILDSGLKMDKKLFVQKYVSNDVEPTQVVESNSPTQQTQVQSPPGTSEIDVSDFFNTTTPIEGVDSIKNINTSNMVDAPGKAPGWEPEVKDLYKENSAAQHQQPQQQQHGTMSIEQQKQIMKENYNSAHPIQQIQQGYGSEAVDINDDKAIDALMNQFVQQKPLKQIDENGLTSEQEYIRQQQLELSGVDPYADRIMKYRSKQGLNPNPIANPRPVQQQPTQQPITQNVEEDEVIKMFKKFKRNYNINIKFSIKDKIGKPEFVQMMADGLDGDIIEYYTNELFRKFLINIDDVKEDIYNQIYKKVYGHDKPIEIEDHDEIEIKSGDEVVLIPGGKTKGGKQKYKFINDKGKVVEMLVKSGQKKQYKPATKKDLK